MDPLAAALKVAASGLGAQSEGFASSREPRQRPVHRFHSGFRALSPQDDQLCRRKLDRATGGALVEVNEIGRDLGDFPVEFIPGHEAADDRGYVKMPNVNVLLEMADMSEANRSYEANLQVIKQARELISMTIDLMRSQ